VARKVPRQRPQVGVLGKDLTRRSKGRCELCDGRTDVRPFELPPFPTDPDPDRALMACGRCRGWLEASEHAPGRVDPVEATFLSTAISSPLPAVRLAAARLLLACDALEDPWLQEALDRADVDPETRELRG
jgi:hypothetical protein